MSEVIEDTESVSTIITKYHKGHNMGKLLRMEIVAALMVVLFFASSLVWGAEKTQQKGAAKTEEEQKLYAKGFKRLSSLKCDVNGDRKPETIILLANYRKNQAIFAVIDNGKFLQLNDGNEYPVENMSKLQGCTGKPLDTVFGRTPKNAFGTTYFYGESASVAPAYYYWNGSKYELVGIPDFDN